MLKWSHSCAGTVLRNASPHPVCASRPAPAWPHRRLQPGCSQRRVWSEHYGSIIKLEQQNRNPAKWLRFWTKKDLCCRDERACAIIWHPKVISECVFSTLWINCQIRKTKSQSSVSDCDFGRSCDEMSEKWLFMRSIKSRCERYAVRSDVYELNTMDQRILVKSRLLCDISPWWIIIHSNLVRNVSHKS